MRFSQPLKYHHPYGPEELTELGISGWPLGFAGRVRYAELDTVNHANNTTYFRWFEAIRYHYMTLWGIPEEIGGPTRVIRSTACTFHREMLMDEDYIVTARTRAFRNTSFTMEYNVLAPDLRASGEAVVVMLQSGGTGRWLLPNPLKDRFIVVDGAIEEQVN